MLLSFLTDITHDILPYYFISIYFYNLLSKENIIQLISITAFCFARNYINEIPTTH